MISGAHGPEVLRQQLPPTWVTRSVRYPKSKASPSPDREPGDDTLRSVRYPRGLARHPTHRSHPVVIGPIPRHLAVAPPPRLRHVRRHVERVRPPARRPTALPLARAAPRTRPVDRVASMPPIWLPAPRRKIIHHSGHRLPPPPPVTPAWEPEKDRRPTALRATDMDGKTCLARLGHLGVPFRRARARRGLRTPVVLTGPVNGLKLNPMWGRRPALMDCRFALLLYRIAPIARRVGVDELRYSSFYSYRNVAGTRRLSRHGNGMAADIFEVRGPGGLRANVLKDWIKAKGRPGDCVAGVTERKARVLRKLACALEYSGILFQVLTPDSNYAHRNHYHLSGMRVGERPLRSRYAGRRVRIRRANK